MNIHFPISTADRTHACIHTTVTWTFRTIMFTFYAPTLPSAKT